VWVDRQRCAKGIRGQLTAATLKLGSRVGQQVTPPHGVDQDHGQAPQRHELEPPRGEPVVARAPLAATGRCGAWRGWDWYRVWEGPGGPVVCGRVGSRASGDLAKAIVLQEFATCFGTVHEELVLIMSMSSNASSNTSSELEQDLRPRARTLSWMASLSVAAGEMRAAEGYLLELLAWCAFADRTVIDVAGDNEGPHQA